MAENENVAKAADILFREIFSVFGWQDSGLRNQNWTCVHSDGHKSAQETEPSTEEDSDAEIEAEEKSTAPAEKEATAKKTHPSDVVFHYRDPYSGEGIYVNVDLKSFGKNTIQKTKIRKALYDLSFSVNCANLSDDWAKLYADGVNERETVGMLFIYNHDNELDLEKYKRFVKQIDPKDLPLDSGRRLYLFGPPEIGYLLAVANDIERCRGRELEDGTKEIPSKAACSFYYPDLISAHPSLHGQKAASIETLVSPWQILRFDRLVGETNQTHYYFYYKGAGASVDEFKYIFDYFFRYNLLDDHVHVSIRMPCSDEKAATYFSQAQDAYAKHFYSLGEFRKRLDRIKFEPLARVIASFNFGKIGMEPRQIE